jgi:YidC/Oxa1 family membrane protein insertase
MANVDPLWVTSVGSVFLIYFNLGRGVTPHNKNNFISRLKGIGQILVILWLPFICYWPAGVTVFIFFSSCLSVLQVSLTNSAWFRSRAMTPQMVAYLRFLVNFQFDQKQSQAFVEAILSGD